ncbi:MAG: aminofutalosine synthase MqnE [Gemmatimonadales bacterium]|nr:aminofutalosine synthase MqnE [Gemmatimonadales bacterium]
MSGALDPGRLGDLRLRPIGDKVLRGERLDPDDGLALYGTSDLLGLGLLAGWVNARRNGDRVFFSANQHINPTNVCVLRNTCVFCSFARMPKEEGAYTRSLDEVYHEAAQAEGQPTSEFHIVGGLHPKLRLQYYTDMIAGLKQRHPSVHIKALTAVEIAHLARIERISERDVLQALKDAGLTSLPGGGAEVFSTAVRATIAERKLTGEEWIRVHRTAHELRIPTNCTMLYGHVETAADRIGHLTMLRALQDETGGFLTYIPLAYHPDHNQLGEEMGRVGTATTGYEDLKNIAVARLYLDNVAHIKTHWPMVTPFLSQIALAFGCDDVEGTVVYERVYHEAGAQTQMHMPYGELVRLIRGAGKRPVERNSLYQPVRERFDDTSSGPDARTRVPAPATTAPATPAPATPAPATPAPVVSARAVHAA